LPSWRMGLIGMGAALSSQFSVLSSQFSVLSSQFSVLSSQKRLDRVSAVLQMGFEVGCRALPGRTAEGGCPHMVSPGRERSSGGGGVEEV
jgi:hypothetical protein